MMQRKTYYQPFCSHCQSTEHNITTCDDPVLVNIWKNALRKIDIRLGSRLIDEDFLELIDFLKNEVSTDLLPVITIRYAPTKNIVGGIDMHIAYICNAIRNESIRFEAMNDIDRQAYLEWFDPESYDFDDTCSCSTVDTFIDNDIPILTKKTIEPLFRCLEKKATALCQGCSETSSTNNIAQTNCGHALCRMCIFSNIDKCSYCQSSIDTLEVTDVDLYDEINGQYSESAEILSQAYSLLFERIPKGHIDHQITTFLMQVEDRELTHQVAEIREDRDKAIMLWQFARKNAHY